MSRYYIAADKPLFECSTTYWSCIWLSVNVNKLLCLSFLFAQSYWKRLINALNNSRAALLLLVQRRHDGLQMRREKGNLDRGVFEKKENHFAVWLPYWFDLNVLKLNRNTFRSAGRMRKKGRGQYKQCEVKTCWAIRLCKCMFLGLDTHKCMHACNQDSKTHLATQLHSLKTSVLLAVECISVCVSVCVCVFMPYVHAQIINGWRVICFWLSSSRESGSLCVCACLTH